MQHMAATNGITVYHRDNRLGHRADLLLHLQNVEARNTVFVNIAAFAFHGLVATCTKCFVTCTGQHHHVDALIFTANAQCIANFIHRCRPESVAVTLPFYRAFDVSMLPLGNTGAQMAGWYRKEIKSAADLKGLKLRIGGLGGHVLSRVGVVPQQLGAGDLYAALEKGVIDAAEFVGPYDDEKLGLYKIAKYYYYPGWWEGSATVALFINQKAMNALPPDYRAALTVACAEANHWMTAKYDIENPPALRRLVAV